VTPFGIYIHWPWCLSKCAYCDFNSAPLGTLDLPRWQAAYRADLQQLASLCPGRTVSSIFFGGGTPSLMPVPLLEDILSGIARLFSLAPDCEISLEANPGATETLKGIAQAGINRLSLGIQSLDDDALAQLGRRHTATEARRALADAQTLFPRVSADFITARPGQTLSAWETELTDILSLGLSHMSIYQLILEPETRLARAHPVMPDEDTETGMYALTQTMTAGAGLPAYEISNHARPGEECRHNLLYWHYGEYAGIGAGAHGRLHMERSVFATTMPVQPESWLTCDGCPEMEALDIPAQIEESLIMGLRLTEGVARARMEHLGWPDARAKAEIRQLVQMGFLEETEGFLRATPEGRLRLNALIARLA